MACGFFSFERHFSLHFADFIQYSVTHAARSRVASGSFDIACGSVCSCQQYPGVSVCGCRGTSSPAGVRQIGRMVYSWSGLFFVFFNQLAAAKRDGGIEG